MKNPWKEIPLTDYENHMKLDSVRQLQTMNEMMPGQFDAYPVSSVMVLGIAGGNGLEHIQKRKFERVYGIDVNSSYLEETARRYPHLDGVLQYICINLLNGADKLPGADMVIANLLVEYIGYECFQNVIRQVKPKYVSCIIQINVEESWVSDSPYLQVFDRLEGVHHQIFQDSCFLQNLEMMRYRRTGEMRTFGNLSHPGSITVFHFHHFKDQMLPILVSERNQHFSAVFKVFCQFFYIRSRIHRLSPASLPLSITHVL